MALILPSTVHNPTTGVAIPASWGDAVNDAIGYIGATAPHCKARKTSAQSISNATWTSITFNVEDWDVGGCHSTGSNTDRFVAPDAGIYRVAAVIPMTLDTTGIRVARLLVNGSIVIDMGTCEGTGSGSSDPPRVATSTFLAAGNYVTVEVWQDSGGSLAVDVTGFPGPWFSMEWSWP